MHSAPGIALGSVKGPVRKENQDRVAAAFVQSPQTGEFLVAVLCDGMGGMVEGGAAATIAASEFLATLILSRARVSPDILMRAAEKANSAVFERLEGAGGSTLTAIVVHNHAQAWAIHIGDSRLYSFGAERSLTLLTRDDTIEGLALGHNRYDEDVLDSRLLQYVGIGDDLHPNIVTIPYPFDEKFILTSDGAHSLGRKVIELVCRNTANSSEWVRRINFMSEATGAEDNASIIALAPDEFVPPRSMANQLTIRLYSAMSELEIWALYPDHLQSPQSPVPKNEPQDTDHKNSGPIKEQTGRQRRARRTKTGKNAAPKPQLMIKFGDRDVDGE